MPATTTTYIDLKIGESCRVGPDVAILLRRMRPSQISLGIDAPRSVPICRAGGPRDGRGKREGGPPCDG